jgi:nickel/cobalt transporter (NiCoT) family protein
MKARVISLYAGLVTANIAAWLWALACFRDYPLLLGTGFLAYSLGLRHAVDADHIAAIDNVTRKLMHEGQRPVSVGLYFSLGHSTVVVLASIAVALSAMAFKGDLETVHAIGGTIGTLVSATFLLVIAFLNCVILLQVFRTFQHVRSGGKFLQQDLDILVGNSGFLARVLRPLFRIVTKSWHTYPLGLLFGLGFDTATEIGVLGIAAAEASRGLSLWSILVFPALFTAGMTLIDTTDSVLMVGAYGWAFVKPIRKLYYNMTITLTSVLVALMVGGLEVLGLVGDQLGLGGAFWDTIAGLNQNFGTIGYLIIALFALSWTVSIVVYRAGRLDHIDVHTVSSF